MSVELNIALPADWSWSPLKFSTTLLSRGMAPDYVEDGPVRVIGQAANQATGFDWGRTRFHDHFGSPKQLRGYLNSGDVLINSTGTGTLGRVGYFSPDPDNLPCIADSHITIARADSQVADSRYMYYWLGSSPFYDYIYSALTVGATNQIELNRERLATAPIALPPLDEQRRIAGFLDVEVNSIERLIQLRSRQLTILNEHRTTKISELLTPGIASGQPSSAIWPWLPNSIHAARLGYAARVQSGVTVHEARKKTLDDADYPYLRVANVQGDRIDLSEVKRISIPRSMAKNSMLLPGDVVMTEANGNPDNLGRGAVWHGEVSGMVHQNHVFAIRVDRRKLLPEYLSLLLMSLHGRRYFRFTSTQVGIATTSSSKVLDLPVPVRTIEEQRSVVKSCHEAQSATGRIVDVLTRQLVLLAERRQALITAAVTGQIDVTTARGVAE